MCPSIQLCSGAIVTYLSFPRVSKSFTITSMKEVESRGETFKSNSSVWNLKRKKKGSTFLVQFVLCSFRQEKNVLNILS